MAHQSCAFWLDHALVRRFLFSALQYPLPIRCTPCMRKHKTFRGCGVRGPLPSCFLSFCFAYSGGYTLPCWPRASQPSVHGPPYALCSSALTARAPHTHCASQPSMPPRPPPRPPPRTHTHTVPLCLWASMTSPFPLPALSYPPNILACANYRQRTLATIRCTCYCPFHYHPLCSPHTGQSSLLSSCHCCCTW